MSRESTIGSWQQLAASLDRAGIPARWSQRAALRELDCIEQLAQWTAPGCPARADAVIGELVGLASSYDGSDPDATLVLLHLLWPGTAKIAGKVRHLCPDAESLVAGELALQIRRFPVGRRTRAFAANLLMDTHAAVWRELEPYRLDRPSGPEIILDPITDAAVLAGRRGRAAEDDLQLVDVLQWARRSGIVDELDVVVLVELAYAREFLGAAQEAVAAWHGWTVRTVQRRERRAKQALRARAEDYLAA